MVDVTAFKIGYLDQFYVALQLGTTVLETFQHAVPD